MLILQGNRSPASGVWGAYVPEGQTLKEDSQLVSLAFINRIQARQKRAWTSCDSTMWIAG